MSQQELSITDLVKELLKRDIANTISEDLPGHITAAGLVPSMIHEKVKVIFHTEADGRVCPECEEYEGEEYDVDDRDRPDLPLHPNCRCFWEHSDLPIAFEEE